MVKETKSLMIEFFYSYVHFECSQRPWVTAAGRIKLFRSLDTATTHRAAVLKSWCISHAAIDFVYKPPPSYILQYLWYDYYYKQIFFFVCLETHITYCSISETQQIIDCK